MKMINSPIKRLIERLLLATFTTLTILGISTIHDNLEQSVIARLLSSGSQPKLTFSYQELNSSPNERVAFICPTP
jgi:hypothetical protein